MTETPKGKIVFSQPAAAEQPPEVELKAQQVFTEQDFVAEPEADTQLPIEAVLHPKKVNWWWRIGSVGVLLAVVFETVNWLQQVMFLSPLTGVFYSVILSCLVIAMGQLLWQEVRKLSRLKRSRELQRLGESLQQESGSDAMAYCDKLASLTGVKDTAAYTQFNQGLSDSHSNREILDLYRHHILSEQDKKAKQVVAKWSSEAALMVAISPLAFVDMLIILWRNTKMVEQVATVYGIELGYYSRLHLFQMVLKNMVFAAGVEVATDLGTDMLGTELAGVMSARVAQGVGAGLISARLGFKAMELCRPMCWQQGERPKAKELRQSLLSKLSQAI
ncbi:YcjF family protein [Motilimonas pumila]|uniref:TIGR01620 family protein n=1 Tax=Motilimonas pumila TaxID=2303987 RepID=A0A418YCB2_9GAMM|nr:TIGR01620 family protein [Motilimonas pumila]RJG42160.1 TIGR01620 family protein [Motilimonas pumila]